MFSASRPIDMFISPTRESFEFIKMYRGCISFYTKGTNVKTEEKENYQQTSMLWFVKFLIEEREKKPKSEKFQLKDVEVVKAYVCMFFSSKERMLLIRWEIILFFLFFLFLLLSSFSLRNVKCGRINDWV